MKKSQNKKIKYFLSPLTGRVLRSDGKTYKHLKNRGFYIEKHKCLYNINSAEKCLKRIFRLYPDLVIPSSNFMSLEKNGDLSKARYFISLPPTPPSNSNQINIQGFVDKNGSIHKLREEISLNTLHNQIIRPKTPFEPEHKNNILQIPQKQKEIISTSPQQSFLSKLLFGNQEVNIKIPKVKDPTRILPKLLNKLEPVSENIHADIKKQLTERIYEQEPLKYKSDLSHIAIYNPLQKDFIPLKKPIEYSKQKEIIKEFNKELIPLELPPIIEQKKTTKQKYLPKIAGIIKDSNNLFGIIKTDQTIKTFPKPITISTTEPTITEPTITELIPKQTEQTKIEVPNRKLLELQKNDFTLIKQLPKELALQLPKELIKQLPKQTKEIIKIIQNTSDVSTNKLVTEKPKEQIENCEDILKQSKIWYNNNFKEIKDQNDIKKLDSNFRKFSLKNHPDKGGNINFFKSASDCKDKLKESSLEKFKKILNTLPQITSISSKPNELIETIKGANKLSIKETKEIINEIKCLDGEQYDINLSRCVPCSDYKLVWDPIYKKCKLMYSEDIKQIEKPISFKLLTMDDDSIIGRME